MPGGYIVVFFFDQSAKGFFLDAGELEYLHDQKELEENLGMWKYLRIEIFRLVVFLEGKNTNKLFLISSKSVMELVFDQNRSIHAKYSREHKHLILTEATRTIKMANDFECYTYTTGGNIL